ncbi:hypothetical protein [Hoeflea poritis]|uniref:Holin n=1 Tax=Hoeflea poritis TaxID=2993659 RepID=A0ABT4VPH5_9HYPH|nr:hypothetical protein [Hoeflea poritis]MDA4845977.1 hypothetical protein [Hoeflea poritis]
MLGHDLKFWIAVVGAIIVKLLLSKTQSVLKALATVVAALFFAWIFTDPMLHFMEWEPETYKAPLAALLALTSEGLLRSLMTINLDKIVEYVRTLRS